MKGSQRPQATRTANASEIEVASRRWDMTEIEILLTIPETCRALKVSRTKVYQLLSDGSLSSKFIGRSRRIPLEEIQRYVRQLPNRSAA